jgi:wobble nucleotide-excising tRNase
MGDPDLVPISSYESTILVRMLYQIATRVNEIVRYIFFIHNYDNFLPHTAHYQVNVNNNI